MVRLHFTFHDLRRVRVADRPYPLIETVLALWRLQGSDAGVLFDSWRRHVRMTAMTEPPMLARLTGLAPNGGGLPSFLVRIGHSQDLDGWIDSVRSAPQARVRGDLASFARAARRPLRGWLRELADTAAARRDLEESLRSFQRAAIAPVAAAMAAAVEHERASRARDLLDGGLDRLFGNLPHPHRPGAPATGTGGATEFSSLLEFVDDNQLRLVGLRRTPQRGVPHLRERPR